jgi:hypothetical protein
MVYKFYKTIFWSFVTHFSWHYDHSPRNMTCRPRPDLGRCHG